MPMLSEKDNREALQGVTPFKPVEKSSFSETFAASVGQVFDENLSISFMLNREGEDQRKSLVRELGDSDRINVAEFTSPLGEIDYNGLSAANEGMGIKTNRELILEREELLAERRAYSEDVISRGSGMAQFLGGLTGYALDPINIMTMPIATAGTAAKSLTAIGRALTVAKNEAALAVAAELAIQPLVYQHKHDINSPYEFSDAIENIVMAATGAAVLGGTVGGIAGYIDNVRGKTSNIPMDADALQSLDYLARVQDDLMVNRENLGIKAADMSEEELMTIDRDFLESAETGRNTANSSFKRFEDYVEQPQPKAPNGTISQRERAVLESQGIAADYDADIAAFKALADPKVIQNDELVSGAEFMKAIDDEIEGIEDVLRCSLG